MRRLVAGLLVALFLGCVVPGASAVPSPVRTVTISSIRTTDATKGVITVVGTLTPAPANGTRIPLHQWIPSLKRWQEVAHGYSNGTGVTITTVQPGSIRTYRIAVGAQAPYAAGLSPMISFKHYVWRGLFKKGLLSVGGAGQPQFNVVPPNEGPRRSEADLLANQGGYVWGEVDSTGCRYSRNWLGNLTDGLVRVSLHNQDQAISSVRMQQETEGWLNSDISGVTRLRLQLADIRSGYGPYVSVDSLLLCTN